MIIIQSCFSLPSSSNKMYGMSMTVDEGFLNGEFHVCDILKSDGGTLGNPIYQGQDAASFRVSLVLSIG